MGVTGSYFERWISTDNVLQEKYHVLEQKITVLEENHSILVKKVEDTVSQLVTRIDTVEKRASNMMFQQQEPDCDLVIIR
jgi:hypothetical protein